MNTIKNRVQLIGHMGAAPEIKTLDNGKKVARFSLATNEAYKNQKGEKVIETSWHNIVAWGNTANLIEKYTEKGMELAIDGKLSSRNYTDKSGNKKYITEIIVNELLILEKKK